MVQEFHFSPDLGNTPVRSDTLFSHLSRSRRCCPMSILLPMNRLLQIEHSGHHSPQKLVLQGWTNPIQALRDRRKTDDRLIQQIQAGASLLDVFSAKILPSGQYPFPQFLVEGIHVNHVVIVPRRLPAIATPEPPANRAIPTISWSTNPCFCGGSIEDGMVNLLNLKPFKCCNSYWLSPSVVAAIVLICVAGLTVADIVTARPSNASAKIPRRESLGKVTRAECRVPRASR